MLQELRKTIGKLLVNIPGWRTGRKIVVFESDDWGAIRMSSRESLNKLVQMGMNAEKCHYMQNDALASENDLTLLFEVLQSYKDSKGRNPVITANTIMANPNFSRIKLSAFEEYHYELFTDSLAKYPQHINSFKLWEKGIEDQLFYPQFHGREHIQVLRWLKFLRKPESETRKAFDLDICGLSASVASENRDSYLAAYDWDDSDSQKFVLESISDGLSIFKSVFGYKSLSSIAPNYTWHSKVEKVYADHGVRYIQGASVQKSPVIGKKGFEKKRRILGDNNDLGQYYLTRNCKFEPSSNPAIDWVDRCLSEIKTAFLWNKPAIIEMHRVNFIGFINPDNRDDNLPKLEQLIYNILKKWPDVEFMTSDQLGKIISNDE